MRPTALRSCIRTQWPCNGLSLGHRIPTCFSQPLRRLLHQTTLPSPARSPSHVTPSTIALPYTYAPLPGFPVKTPRQRIRKRTRRKPSFLQEDAFWMLIGQKHVNIAVNHLVKGDLSAFDPLMMDASCQAKVPVILDAYERVQAYLDNTGIRHEMLEEVINWERVHADDLPATKVKTVEDVIGGGHNTRAYDDMVAALRNAVGDKLMACASLSMTLSISSKLFYEEMGGLFWWLEHFYRSQSEGAPADEKSLVIHLWSLRTQLATLTTQHISDKLLALTSPEYQKYRAVLGNHAECVAWDSFTDQIAEALRLMTSRIEQPDGSEVVLQSLFPQVFAIFLLEYAKGRGFTTMIRRVEMTPVVSTGTGGESVEGQGEQNDFTYRLTDVRAHRWIPGQKTFELQDQTHLSNKDANAPGFFIELYSYYLKNSTGAGLDSANDEEYFSTLERKGTDIVWLIMQGMQAHPPYTGHAISKETSEEQGPIIQRICTPQSQPPQHPECEYTRESCKGFMLREPLQGEQSLSLYEIWHRASMVAAARGLSHGEEFTRRSLNDVFERRRAPIDLTAKHIRVMSYKQAIELCERILAPHRSHRDPEARYGGYVARVGDRGYSCETRREAEEMRDTKKNEDAIARYLEKYPHNEAFEFRQA